MSSKLIIPVCLFIACQALYDNYAPARNTNWSIFYFVSMYLAWLILIWLLPKKQLLPYIILGLGISVYIIIQLLKINMPFDEYRVSVNSFELCLLPVAVMITGLTFYLLRK